MKFLASLLALFALFTASSVARADSIFDVSGTFVGGGTLSGTLDYNGSGFDGVNLLVKEGGYTDVITSLSALKVFGDYDLFSVNLANLGVLYLDLPVNSLKNFTGTNLCSTTDHACGLAVSGFDLDPLKSGSITALAPTPEPSSMLLMGTGLVGMAGMMRRRFRRA